MAYGSHLRRFAVEHLDVGVDVRPGSECQAALLLVVREVGEVDLAERLDDDEPAPRHQPVLVDAYDRRVHDARLLGATR